MQNTGIKQLGLSVAAVLSAALIWTTAARANFLQNPSFETGDFSAWTVGGNPQSEGVALAGTPLGSFDFGPAVAIAQDGNFSGYYVGNNGNTFTLTQSVTLPAGTFDVGVFIGANNPSSQILNFAAQDQIYIDGVLAPTNPFLFVNNGFMGELFVSGVQLDAGQHTFEFSFNNSGFGTNAFSIDEAFVSPPTTPVPEPSTLALLGIAIAGTLGAARRRKNAKGPGITSSDFAEGG